MKTIWFFLCAISFSIFAQTANWDVEKAVPPVTVIGEDSPKYEQAAQAMRARLMEQLNYWQARGLTKPPPLEGIYIFSEPGNVQVQEVMELLNPSLPNFLEHFKAQRAAFEGSAIYHLLRGMHEDFVKKQNEKAAAGKKAMVIKASSQEIGETLFDYYCLLRYGFAVEGTYKAVMANQKLVNAKPAIFSPDRDNAIYGRFPRIDLTEILVPLNQSEEGSADPASTKSRISLNKLVKMSVLQEMFRDQQRVETLLSRRIVILPRTTEGMAATDSDMLSSVNDPSIDRHENGHHMNSTLARNHQGLNRMLEEIFADYLAQAPTGQPVVGQFFAEASAIAAGRLGERSDLDIHEVRVMKSLEKLGERGYLRTFDTEATIDSINRRHILSNSYDGGDPARGFLWRVRQQLTADQQLRFDELTVKVIQELGHVPSVISGNATMALMIRGLFKTFAAQAMLSRELKKVLEENHKDIERVHAMAREKMLSDPDLLRQIAESVDPTAKQQEILLEIASEIVTPSRFNAEIEAQLRVTERLKEKEEGSKSGAFWSYLGFGARHRVEADYVLPELFRIYASFAQAEYPEFRPLIIKEAEAAMNAKAVSFTLQDGSQEIVFVRRQWTGASWLAKKRLQKILQARFEMRAKWEELQGQKANIDVEEFADRQSALEQAYGRNLEGLQEFERTNKLRHLYWPFPVTNQIRRAFVGVKGELTGESADKKSETGTAPPPAASITSACAALL